MALHEIRDPIHNFIRLDDEERSVLDSRPFQRLRHIHQLALTYLVYPGATHRRFEHSLGVMELATRIFDTVTRAARSADSAVVRNVVPEGDQLRYWRRVLRMAALLHDVGHLPFSHAAEDLLPKGWRHERLTVEAILNAEMRPLWKAMTPPLQPEHVAMLAVGPQEIARIPLLRDNPDYRFGPWQALLSEIIVGDAFGADRMDYLLRDSHHAGVAYGRFDHYRLVDTLRILPSGHAGEGAAEPVLGVEEGGLHAAESLLWARYLMYTQVYFHHVRRIYDLHLSDFLRAWLPGGTFSTSLDAHLDLTDHQVTAAMLAAARDESHAAHTAARAIVDRQHFRLVYSRNPQDQAENPMAAKAVFDALCDHLGAENVRLSQYHSGGANVDFPVLPQTGREVVSSRLLSDAIQRFPPLAVEYVFTSPDQRDEAVSWLQKHRTSILSETTP